MAQRLLNKVAVITGASGAIGGAIVSRFLAEGAKVVMFGPNGGRLEELAALAPARTLIVDGDATRPADRESLVQTTVRRFGAVDVIALAAQTCRVASLQETTPELLSEILSVNLESAVQTIRAFVGHLNAGASIVVLTASGDRSSSAGLGPFAASQAALASWAQVVASELSSRGIRINCVAPALSPNQTAVGPSDTATESAAKTTAGLESDVADAVLFLATNEAAGISGQELRIDGRRPAMVSP